MYAMVSTPILKYLPLKDIEKLFAKVIHPKELQTTHEISDNDSVIKSNVPILK
jgi:hypothetical protein